jgi:glycosyltransferase involved in cell wall biosynthesis
VGGTKEILAYFDPEFLFQDTSAEAMAKGIRGAIEKYLTNGKQYAALRVRSREYAARNYSWQRHIDQLRSIICEVISYRNKSRK